MPSSRAGSKCAAGAQGEIAKAGATFYSVIGSDKMNKRGKEMSKYDTLLLDKKKGRENERRNMNGTEGRLSEGADTVSD